MRKITVMLLILTLSLKINAEYKNELKMYMKKIYEIKNKKCKFSKKNLEAKKYNLQYTVIEGYWKNNYTPFGEWKEWTYTNKILKTQCYTQNDIFFKSYSYGKVVTVTYIDENIRLDGAFDENGNLIEILYFSHKDENFSLDRLFSFKNEMWKERIFKYPTLLELDIDTYLYLIDKEKLKKKG